MSDDRFESWAVVELFGHARIAGKVTEATIGGCSLIRVDVPEVTVTRNGWQYDEAYGGQTYAAREITMPAYTKFLGQGSIYALTPCSEEVARKVAQAIVAEPIQGVEMARTKALPAPAEAENPGEPELEDDQILSGDF